MSLMWAFCLRKADSYVIRKVLSVSRGFEGCPDILDLMPQISIPRPKPPEAKRKVSLQRVAARWKVPIFYVRHTLLMNGVPIVSIERPAAEAVMWRDLLELERKLPKEGSNQ